LRKNFRTDLHKIFREGWHWKVANEQMIKFGGDLDTGIVFRIRYYWEITDINLLLILIR